MAFVTTYKWPGPIGIVAPTKQQAFGHNQVVVDVNKGASGDTTVVLTHNMQLTAAELAAFFPDITLEPTALGFYSALPFVSAFDANTITITCATGGGTVGDIFTARIRRPASLSK